MPSDLFLVYLDPNQEIVIASDASNYGVGVVILHKYKDGTMKAVAHKSRSLLPAETKYSQIEKETLAIIYTIKNSTSIYMEEVLLYRRINTC